MSRRAKFRVLCEIEKGRPDYATITIDRERGLVSVRPLRRRRVFELPLAWVAEAIADRVRLRELAEKRAAKKARRTSRG